MAWLPSYPKIFTLGHRAVKNLLDFPVTVEEKVDGSQISFGLGSDGELHVRSKGAELNIIAPDKMFAKGVEVLKSKTSLLKPGWVYRGEYLAKPKHNTLAYDRNPKDFIVIFDICTGVETYLSPDLKRQEAARVGFEAVPELFSGKLASSEDVRELLKRQSFLGTVPIEGVVIKPLAADLFGIDGKLLIAKFVSEDFKEVHRMEWRDSNPTGLDICEKLGTVYKTPARWQKAVGHLRDAGKLEDSPKDIGLIIREVPKDILAECEADIKDKLFEWAWPKISRLVNQGLAEWYKEQLLAKQFEVSDVQANPLADSSTKY